MQNHDFETPEEEREREAIDSRLHFFHDERPAAVRTMRSTLDQRFWSKVDASDPDGCWPWMGYVMPNGYGTHAGPDGRTTTAHRVAYLLTHGDIPEGLHLDHLCRNRRCVNPDHLEAVTQAENNRRGESPWAVNARRTECIHGHPYDAENTLINSRGERQCRACKRSRDRAAYRARQAATDERRAAVQLHGDRSGTVSAAPITPPVHGESRRSIR